MKHTKQKTEWEKGHYLSHPQVHSYIHPTQLDRIWERPFHALQKAYQGAHLRKHKSFHNLYCHFHPTVRTGQVFASSRRRIGTCLRRPSISAEKRDTAKWFLQWPDISYCKCSWRKMLNMTLKSHTIQIINL